MGCYFTKSQLYEAVSKVKEQFHLDEPEFRLNFLLAYNKITRLTVRTHPFKTPGLRGMAQMGQDISEDDIIILNSTQDTNEQRFSCSHEFLHLVFHRDEKRPVFRCFDKVRPGQNSFYEWHANEGAAELLVPYKKFIPRYVELAREQARKPFSGVVIKPLAEEFGVSECVITHRIDNLNYEICRYLEGIDLEEIVPLSQNQLRQMGWNAHHEKWYCRECLSPVLNNEYYCSICGKYLKTERMLSKYNKGAGYMVYDGINLRESMRCKTCPNCGNEEIENNAVFCKICGRRIINSCAETSYLVEDDHVEYGYTYGNTVPACEQGHLLPGNARYCPYCGNETTFNQLGYLDHWDKKIDVDTAKANSSYPDPDEEDLPF